MTKMTFSFYDREWVLTDEASQSSYGEPVLVADDGTQMRAAEIATVYTQDIDMQEIVTAVSAYDVVTQGERNNGEDISSEDYPAFSKMFWRFARQCETGRRAYYAHVSRFGQI